MRRLNPRAIDLVPRLSSGRVDFAVDANVLRVMTRLGWLKNLGISAVDGVSVGDRRAALREGATLPPSGLPRPKPSPPQYCSLPQEADSVEQPRAKRRKTRADQSQSIVRVRLQLWTADSEVTASLQTELLLGFVVENETAPDATQVEEDVPKASPNTNSSSSSRRWTTSSSAFRRRRCNTCEACRRVDCGVCSNCSDMPKFGGPGTKRQSCVLRRCHSFHNPLIGSGTLMPNRSDDEDAEVDPGGNVGERSLNIGADVTNLPPSETVLSPPVQPSTPSTPRIVPIMPSDFFVRNERSTPTVATLSTNACESQPRLNSGTTEDMSTQDDSHACQEPADTPDGGCDERGASRAAEQSALAGEGWDADVEWLHDGLPPRFCPAVANPSASPTPINTSTSNVRVDSTVPTISVESTATPERDKSSSSTINLHSEAYRAAEGRTPIKVVGTSKMYCPKHGRYHVCDWTRGAKAHANVEGEKVGPEDIEDLPRALKRFAKKVQEHMASILPTDREPQSELASVMYQAHVYMITHGAVRGLSFELQLLDTFSPLHFLTFDCLGANECTQRVLQIICGESPQCSNCPLQVQCEYGSLLYKQGKKKVDFTSDPVPTAISSDISFAKDAVASNGPDVKGGADLDSPAESSATFVDALSAPIPDRTHTFETEDVGFRTSAHAAPLDDSNTQRSESIDAASVDRPKELQEMVEVELIQFGHHSANVQNACCAMTTEEEEEIVLTLTDAFQKLEDKNDARHGASGKERELHVSIDSTAETFELPSPACPDSSVPDQIRWPEADYHSEHVTEAHARSVAEAAEHIIDDVRLITPVPSEVTAGAVHDNLIPIEEIDEPHDNGYAQSGPTAFSVHSTPSLALQQSSIIARPIEAAASVSRLGETIQCADATAPGQESSTSVHDAHSQMAYARIVIDPSVAPRHPGDAAPRLLLIQGPVGDYAKGRLLISPWSAFKVLLAFSCAHVFLHSLDRSCVQKADSHFTSNAVFRGSFPCTARTLPRTRSSKMRVLVKYDFLMRPLAANDVSILARALRACCAIEQPLSSPRCSKRATYAFVASAPLTRGCCLSSSIRRGS